MRLFLIDLICMQNKHVEPPNYLLVVLFHVLTTVSIDFRQKQARSRNVNIFILKCPRWPHILLNDNR